jgi:hypothetical protein
VRFVMPAERVTALTENLVAAEAFYTAIGLRRRTDWEVARMEDGTPVAMPRTAEAQRKLRAAMNAAVKCLNGWVD